MRSMLLKTGLPQMSGTISKQKEYLSGYPVSYININLSHVLPEDIPSIIDAIKSEMISVESENINLFKPV